MNFKDTRCKHIYEKKCYQIQFFIGISIFSEYATKGQKLVLENV